MTRIQALPFRSTAIVAPARKRSRFRLDTRASGLLLHPTSLPGPHYSGDLGPQAFAFADFLASAGQRWWQMLPINPPGAAPGYSPYSSYSAFAGSAWLISLENLAEEGLLDARDVAPPAHVNGRPVANLAASIRFRLPRLRKAYETFKSHRGVRSDSFADFCGRESSWLDDDSLFSAIKDAYPGRAWSSWPMDLRLRKPEALRAARARLADSVDFHRFIQFTFDRQWNALKDHCNKLGVGLIGDIPIFVAHDSSDVWAHRELFLLNSLGRPETVSGYPPDSFNADGQLWGHPHYDWPAHQTSGWEWWIARFARTLSQFDAARIDHFLGFHRSWHIPGRAKTARRGQWVRSPGEALFDAVRGALGSAQIIAEDLGKLTREASRLRDKYKFPGMRVMQFGFGDGGAYHLPFTYPRRCVAYPGTHDNATIVAWFSRLRGAELKKVKCFLDIRSGKAVHWAMIRALLSSVADTVVFPVQDVLGLDDAHRMNVPGTAEGNWRWRLRPGQLSALHEKKLRELAHVYGRT